MNPSVAAGGRLLLAGGTTMGTLGGPTGHGGPQGEGPAQPLSAAARIAATSVVGILREGVKRGMTNDQASNHKQIRMFNESMSETTQENI